LAGFAEALEQLLTERNISQNELGRRIGVSGAAVNLWVQGRSAPTRKNVELILDELAVEPRGWLLELAGYSASCPETTVSPEVAIRADPGLHPEDKRALLHVLRIARERHTQAGEGLP
jgi:transcriptional regulator with XRE-family HTH domain